MPHPQTQPPPASSGRSRGPAGRRVALSLVLALALLAGAIALLGHLADYHALARVAARAQRPWLIVCLAGELAAYAGAIMAYRDLARVGGGPRVDVWTACRVVVLSFGAFVLGASVGGLGADYWALHQASQRPHQSARRVIAMNSLEWAVLGLFACVAAVVVLVRATPVPAAMTLSWLAAVPLCTALAFWFTQPCRVGRLAKLRDGPHRPGSLRPLGEWWRWLPHGGRTLFADALGGVLVVRTLLRHPVRYRAGVLGLPLYWAGDLLALYAALRALGVSVDVWPLVLAYASGYVVTSLPLPAGGAGVVEATLASTLAVVGVPFGSAVLAAVTYRVFAFWLPLVPALLLLPGLPRLARDLAAAPLEAATPALAELTGEAERSRP